MARPKSWHGPSRKAGKGQACPRCGHVKKSHTVFLDSDGKPGCPACLLDQAIREADRDRRKAAKRLADEIERTP